MAKGKYDHIIDNLPTWQHEEPTYQAKVDAKKREIALEIGESLSSANVALLFKQARLQKDAAEKVLYDINLELAAVTQMLIDRFEIDEITKVQLDSGDSVGIHYEPYSVIEDKEKLWQWCKENGYEREMQLSWQTLNGIVKERLLKGEPEPDGVRAFSYVKPKYYKS